MKKLEMHSESLINENIAKLAELFPECVTEVVNEDNKLEKQVDFEVFKSLFKNSIITENKERYQFTWPGKLAAREEAFIPTDRSLRPCKEESVNFDTTENLYIEGDNLTVLKLLRHTYHGKIKMIYIDPPYNTGNDFVYNDQFKQNKAAYDQISGEYDELGNRLYTNTAGGGHFHTNWLNMMYPRLLLARDLLAKDGIIFISIDDNEKTNLTKICDEIFGESNFISEFFWEKKKKPSFLHRNVGKIYDYVLCYSKNASLTDAFSVDKTTEGKKFPINNAGNGLSRIVFPPNTVHFSIPDQNVPAQDMSEGNIITKLLEPVQIENGLNKTNLILEGEWRYSQAKINEIIANRETISISKIPFRLNHVKAGGEVKKMRNVLSPTSYSCETNEDGTAQITSLMGTNCFDNPKPVGLIKLLIQATLYNSPDSYILDFFSGSATTAHAVMKFNAEDGGHRKFIMVQLPENCSDDSEAYKSGYKNICEIGKERIRRAGKQILDELNAKNEGSLFEDKAKMDVGFRVFKQSDSMLADLSVKPEDADQLTFKQMSSKIKNDRTPEDLLFYSMLELGVPLSEKIELISIKNHSVYKVENANLIACFDREIDEEMVTEVAKMNPDYFILREDSIDDSLINNIDSIFKVYSKNIDVEDRIRML